MSWDSKSKYYHSKAKLYRQQRDERINNQRFKLSHLSNQLQVSANVVQKVINSDVCTLVQMLNDLQVTSQELVLIFAIRTAKIGIELCLITQDNFDEALKTARDCDHIRKQTNLKNWTPSTLDEQYLPPLFGIPISIKDSFQMKGFASTLGLTSRYEIKEQHDGVIISVLRSGGLIPFVKTNVPQVLMIYETNSHLWGRALNPWDRKRTPGGSSGGQSGLISSRCSPIGLGSDIGGSIRIPAQFCGLFGIKPSSRRLTIQGHSPTYSTLDGQINIPISVGPIGKSVEDLARFMKVACDPKNFEKDFDPYHKCFQFDYAKYNRTQTTQKLNIGYFEQLDLIEPSKASVRAVRETVQNLKKQGHNLIKIQIPGQEDLISCFYQFLAAEGNMKAFETVLKGEQRIPEYNTVKRISNLPKFLHWIICLVLKRFRPRLGFLISNTKAKSAYEYLILSTQQIKLKARFMEMWKQNKLDVIIAPGFGSQAQLCGLSEKANTSAAYTYMWNFLDLPAGCVPVTVVKQQQQTYQSVHNDFITTSLQLNAQSSAGLPVGIQVIGLPFEEEKVLGVMKIVDNNSKFYHHHNFPL